MVKNVILKYANGTTLNVDRLCSYQINSLKKTYLVYSLKEVENEQSIVYFGELLKTEPNYEMVSVKSEDLEEFRKLLMELAKGSLTSENSNYVSVEKDLEGHTVVVTGGGKAKMHISVLENYFHGVKEEKEEIETLDFDEEPTPVLVKPEEEKPILAAPIEEEEKPILVKEETKQEPKKEDTPKKEKKKGKGILIVLLVVFILGAICVGGYFWIKENNRKADVTPSPSENVGLTLEQIAGKLQNSTYVQQLISDGDSVIVGTTTSDLTITTTVGMNSEYRYTLSGEELIIAISKEDTVGIELTHNVYNVIQELLGNDDDVALDAIDGLVSPTLMTEGIKVTEEEDTYSYTISTSTKGNFDTILSSEPVSISQFEEQKDALKDETTLTFVSDTNTVTVIKQMVESQLQLVVLEENELSANGYQSVLNFLRVAYDEEESTLFEESYPGFEIGNMELSDYRIEVDGELSTELSETYPKDKYHWATVTIIKIDNEG